MNNSKHTTSIFLWIMVLQSSFFLVISNPDIFKSSYAAENKRSDDLSLESLHTLIQQQSAVIQQKSAVIQQQSAALTSIQSRLTTSESQIHKLQQKVAFSAHFTEGGPINIGASSPIAFSHVSYNLGHGYDHSSGVFTAPTAGVYLFLLNAKPNAHGDVGLAVVKSGSVILVTDLHYSSTIYDEATAFTVVHVNAGETVFVRHNSGPTVIDKWQDTAFAGILLYAD